MRKFPAAVLMIVIGLLGSAPVAAAEARPVARLAADPPLLFCWQPVPAGWTQINFQHFSCGECWTVGEAGVSRGDWADYRCRIFPVGLDVAYYLYVPPDSQR